ncbi:MAG: hypothetical protein ACREJ6_12920 [Candidatus Methylomirabilis sp.]
MRREVSVILRLSGVNGVFLGVFLATSALGSAGMDERASVVSGSLYRKALEDGSVRVIVQLKVAALPEGQLGSADAVASQRQAIAAAQSALLAELANSRYRVVRTYETIPFLALEVSADGFRVLEGSALVAGVEEDRVDSPRQGADGAEGAN